jgi:hypothetical protein
MTDFDANEDHLRLSGPGKDESSEPPKLHPRFAPRARQLAYGQCFHRSPRRVDWTLTSQRTRAVRRSCSPEARIELLGAPPRRRRRLWTLCHGRLPGSPS